MLEKLSKMSVREAMITLADGVPGHGELPRWLTTIARKANISFRTARSLWNNEITNPDHLAAREIKRLAQIKEARRDALMAAEFFDRRAATLASIDPDFHRHEIDAFVEAARAIRNRNSTGDCE
jgi:hypothetical protein